MWYLGQGSDEHWHQRVCLAKSRDGRNWEKPDLGLVEYHGSKHNNLVDMGEDIHVQACVIFYEPEDPDPDRRFKMSYETRKHSGLCAAYMQRGLIKPSQTELRLGIPSRLRSQRRYHRQVTLQPHLKPLTY